MELKDLLKMDLQYFADDPEDKKGDGQQGDDPEDGGSGGDDDKGRTFTRAEMAKMLNAEREKVRKEEQQNLQDQIDEAVKKAQKEATLTGKELQKYKEEEHKRKLEELQQENERLKQEGVKRDLREQAVNTLAEKGLDVNEKILNFVVRDTAEETLEAIDDMAALFHAEKEKFAEDTPPPASNNMGGTVDDQSMGSILDKGKITDF